MNPPNHNKGLRTVAILEASKGLVVLMGGLGLLTALDENVGAFADQWVRQMHLNPASHYPQIFIEMMSNLDNTHLWLLAGLAVLYSTIRLVEAYGLWHQRRWAEWLAALGGAIYIPIEIYELFERVSLVSVGALLINLGIVAYMVWILQESRSRRSIDPEKA